MKKINWFDHFVNLVVVIGGITIAFTMDNWKETRKQAVTEQQYVDSFIRDLTEDKNELEELITSDSTQFNSLIQIFKLQSINDPIDSLEESLNWMGTYNQFSGQNITFESLQNSGKFEELWGLELRMKILNNYHKGYGKVRDIEVYFQKNFDDNVLPYFINEMIFKNQDRRKEQVLEPHFKNILAFQISFLKQKIDATRELKETTEELLNLFEEMNP